jgi:GDP-4-dehydro-6-deoxy-D-mannose reductase
MPKAFITGISGFVGGHLSKILGEQGWHVSGYDLRAPAASSIEFYEGDIADERVLSEAIQAATPEAIFHLAGLLKADRVADFYTSHVAGTTALFEAILRSTLKPRVLIASSSAVYGSGDARPITEQRGLRPLTHYAVSKAAQELLGLRYALAYGMQVICVRTFNLLGPGLSPQMACSSFARQIALAEMAGDEGEILTGNLSTRRDFIDVRDAARAFVAMAGSATPGIVYNICSGHSVAMKRCLDILIGMSGAAVHVTLDPNRLQSGDVPVQVGSASRLKHDTGWRPRIGLRSSLRDMLNYWRDQVGLEANRR